MKKCSIYDQMTRSERDVAQMLKEMSIRWSYEHPVFVWDENKRPKAWTSDFYLISFGVYIKVCGSKDFDYDYIMKIFDKNGYKVIFLHLYKKSTRWKNHFMIYLKLFTKYRIHKLNQIITKDN